MNLDHFEKEGDAFYREIARKVGATVEATPEAVRLCLERMRSLVLSDRVGFIFNVSAGLEGQRLVLTGETERAEFKNIACGVFRHLGFTNLVDRIELVPDLKKDPAPFAVTVKPCVMSWSRPDLTGIPMDESLCGEPVYLFKELPGCFLIKNFSGYWGYAAKDGFRRISKQEFIQLANAPKAMLTADHKTNETLIPAGSRLRLKEWGRGQTCLLLDPSGQEMEVPKTICQRNDREQDIARVLALARSFLDRPYNMGGKNSATGIDCSGLVQLSYRAAGLNLARDAKQQYLSGNLLLPCVAEALLPGDAVFFMNETGQVDHTGLYLGEQKILHATGAQVKIQSMNPAAKDYLKRFDHEFVGAKRYWR
ncbi:MAG: C40 family peptidase [Verrucomicrobia bacterium]|nr:C40 family peptidase [Verrucomicrobiota bacterium]